MKTLKKSALSLAVAGVVYGTAITPVYADDETITTGQNSLTVSVAADSATNIQVTDGDTVTVTGSIYSTGSADALTIDVTGASDGDGSQLVANIVVDGNIDGSTDGASSGDPNATGKGLFITDSDNGVAETFQGNVTVNGNITGEGAGLESGVDIEGNVTIASSSTIKGIDQGDDTTGYGVKLAAVTGTVTNNGAVISEDPNGVAFEVGAVSAGFVNAGSITASTADGATSTALKIDGTITNGVSNTGSITGVTAINATAGTTTFTNAATGSVSGNIAGGANINLVNEGNISSATIAAGTLTNTSGTIATTGNASFTGAVDNDATLNVGGTLDVTAGGLDNSGTVNVTGLATITAGGLTNTGTLTASDSLTITAGGLANGAADKVNSSLSVAETLTITAGDSTNFGSVSAKALTHSSGTLDNGSSGDDGVKTSSITVTGAMATGGIFNNYGTVSSGNLALGGAFTNAGTASVGVISGAHNVTNSGTLSIKSDSNIDTADFNGSGGTLNIEFTDLSHTGIRALGSSGSITFDGDSVINVTLADDLLSSPRTGNLNIAQAEDTGLTLTANPTINGTQSLFVTIGTNYPADDETLTASYTIKSATDVTKSLGYSASTQEVAAKVQSGLTSSEVKTALNSAYGAFGANASNESVYKKYLNNVRPDDSNSAAASAATAGQAAMSNIASRSASVRTGASYGDMQAAGGFWIQGLYGKSDQKEREGALGYKGDLRGMSFGLDREMGGSTTGIAFSYGKSDVDFDRDQKDMVKSYIASVYNIWEHGNMYVDSSLSVGSSKHESKRVNGTATADYGSMMLGGQAMVGYYMNYGEVMFEPKAGARLTMVNVDGYTRKLADGSAFETVQDQSYRQMELGFGATVSKSFAMANGALTPSFGAMYYHDVVGDQMDAQVNFAGDDYAIKGASAVKGSWEINLGLDYAMGENLTMSAGYTRVMKNDFSSDNFNAKLKYMF